jgi:hypothetical protein
VSGATAAPRAPAPNGAKANRRAARLLPLCAVAIALVAVGLDRLGGRGGVPNLEAVPAVLRTVVAALVLFGLSGAALVARWLPARLRTDAALFVLPVGAISSALALTLLGFAGAPMSTSLPLVLVAGAVSAVLALRGGGLRALWPAGESRLALTSAVAVGTIVVAVALSPFARDDGFATVLGQNGDAHLATGAATLLQHAGPGDVAPALPVDRMPGAWKSKYPIYYSLAGVSSLSGLDPVKTFVAFGAVMLALTALGFMLLARHMLAAGTTAALLAMALIGLSEQALVLVHAPFYNQLWGSFALPFTLLATWLYLRDPGRAQLALAGGFALVGFLAYPLLAPFTAAFALVCGAVVLAQRRRAGERPRWIAALDLPRGRRWLVLWILAGLIALLFSLALAGPAIEKIVGGLRAALPGGDLSPWSGEALGFLGIDRALGVSAIAVLGPLLLVLALYALARRERDVSVPLLATAGGLMLAAAYLRLRAGGELFVFKALSFAGLIALCAASVGMVELALSRGRLVRMAGVGLLGVVIVGIGLSSRQETRATSPHLTRDVAQIQDWSAELPAGRSVRVDIAAYGFQQWAWYMLADRPVSSLSTLLDFFPHAPLSRKADYLLVDNRARPPRDAAGAPLRENRSFALYRMRPDVPGPDVSSRRMIDPFVPSDGARPGALALPPPAR